jgi:uncharacterized membrane protein YvbJ
MFCTHCGNALNEGVRFCSKCGSENYEGNKLQILKSGITKSFQNIPEETKRIIIISILSTLAFNVLLVVIHYFTYGRW